MAQNSTFRQTAIQPWHSHLLLIAAIASTLLIAMGGILCVTQSIRACPDWPGCYGKLLPPSEPGPIIEFTHRLLAAVSGLLILGAAIAGLVKKPRHPWVTYPPLFAVLLVIEVSYFGARVVLKGLSPGWAAVDVGSALLVVALMVLSAVVALEQKKHPGSIRRLDFSDPYSRLAWATTALVFIILVSGVLVAGKNFLTGCLGWPFYSLGLARLDEHTAGSILRSILSIITVGMLLIVMFHSWKMKQKEPTVFRLASLVGSAFLVELVVQALLFLFSFTLPLLVIYTISAAFFWGLLVAFSTRTSLSEKEI